jgi:hypothetical protein
VKSFTRHLQRPGGYQRATAETAETAEGLTIGEILGGVGAFDG